MPSQSAKAAKPTKPAKPASIEDLLAALPPERRAVLERLRATFAQHLPPGFEQALSYGMIGFVVPHNLYPAGYHCDPKLPLPFVSLAASQSAFSIHHMGLYADEALLAWFCAEHAKASRKKLDLGKSCIRYKAAEDIPFELLARLAARLSPPQWVALYERQVKPAAR